jgi:hypothetical protein
MTMAVWKVDKRTFHDALGSLTDRFAQIPWLIVDGLILWSSLLPSWVFGIKDRQRGRRL